MREDKNSLCPFTVKTREYHAATRKFKISHERSISPDSGSVVSDDKISTIGRDVVGESCRDYMEDGRVEHYTVC